MNDLISVIVPVYNVENYLRQCLDSIINQTYRNLEILLIEDCSMDGSLQICEDYVARDSRVKLLRSPHNMGLSHARNVGIVNMTGTYVTFIDSDDWVDESYIQVMYDSILANDADIAMVDYCRFNDETGTYYIHTFDERVEELSTNQYFSELFRAATNTYVVAWGKLFKASLFEENLQIRFPVGKVAEDKYTTHRLFMKSEKTMFIRKTYYCWRHRSGSISSNSSLAAQRDDFEGSQKRLLDCFLAGQSVDEALVNYHQFLGMKKNYLEEIGLNYSDLYHSIVAQLDLITNRFKE